MAYKPVGADETGQFPPRVVTKLKGTIAGEVADTASATRAALDATYGPAAQAASPELGAAFVPKWKAATTYPYGSVVVSPNGSLVTARSTHTSGATFDITAWEPQAGTAVNVLDYGAVADGVRKTSGGNITSGSTTFTSSVVNFSGKDVGKRLWVLGAGAGSSVLSTTIASVGGANSVTLANAASTTVANGQFVYGTLNRAAFQAASDKAKTNGGTVFVPPQGIYLIEAAFNLWSRVRLVGGSAAPNGCVLMAAPGITGSVLKLGATDGTDPNWHWGAVENIAIDGNRAFQTAQPTVAVTAAVNSSSVIATFTTAAAHGFALGDSIEFAGFTPAGYNGRYFVNSVISTTQFTVNLMTGTAAGTVMGTARRVLQGISLPQAGETSHIENVVVQSCFNDGIHQGPIGTPMVYKSVSVMANLDAGINLWTDRPVTLYDPSGDTNGQCLIRINGKSLQSGGNNVGSITIIGPKAENAVSPFLIIDDYGHSINILGGSVVMGTGNTAPVIQRTAQSSGNAPLNVIGLVAAPIWAGSGNIFQDLSVGASSVNGNSSASSYTFFLTNLNPVGIKRLAGKRVTLTDAATVAINAGNGNFMTLNCLAGIGATRTIGVPVVPVGAPNAERLTLYISNSTGGAMTTSWHAAYKLAGAWVDPANGFARMVEFIWNGTNMVEIARSQADAPI